MPQRSVAEDLVRNLPTTPFVAGRFESGPASASFDDVDPVTEKVLTTVAEADAETVDRAVVSARRALDEGEVGRMYGAAPG